MFTPGVGGQPSARSMKTAISSRLTSAVRAEQRRIGAAARRHAGGLQLLDGQPRRVRGRHVVEGVGLDVVRPGHRVAPPVLLTVSVTV